MQDSRPVVIVPKSPQVSRMLEAEPLLLSSRAQHVGIVVIAPRTTKPADLMVACHFWPKHLKQAGVARVAVVLAVEAYVTCQLLLPVCDFKMAEQGVSVAYFHEGHLESDQIHAWFEQRRARRRVTSDALIRLSERYAERGDVRSACHAVRLAEAVAA